MVRSKMYRWFGGLALSALWLPLAASAQEAPELFAGPPQVCAAGADAVDGDFIAIKPKSIGICTWTCADGTTGRAVAENGDQCPALCLVACLLSCDSHEWHPT
jgi:hypothetical protein